MNNLVIARYENTESWKKGLLIHGQGLTRDNILAVDPGAYAWTPQSDNNPCGFMKILAGSEEEAKRLLDSRLSERFRAAGLSVEYRGKVGIPKGSSTTSEIELRKLVRKTLVEEALGTIEQYSIQEI